MATDRYRKHKALNPFFDVVMKGLKGLVEGEHYYDAIADDAQFDFPYRFPGSSEVIHGRENSIAAYSGYGDISSLKKVMDLRFTMTRNAVWSLWNTKFMARPSKRALRMTTDSCPSLPSRIGGSFTGEITWTLSPHSKRSLANEKWRRSEAQCMNHDPSIEITAAREFKTPGKSVPAYRKNCS